MIPVIIFLSYLLGEPFIDTEPIKLSSLENIDLNTIHRNFLQYVIGAVLLATLGGVVSFILSLGAFSALRKAPKSVQSP